MIQMTCDICGKKVKSLYSFAVEHGAIEYCKSCAQKRKEQIKAERRKKIS